MYLFNDLTSDRVQPFYTRGPRGGRVTEYEVYVCGLYFGSFRKQKDAIAKAKAKRAAIADVRDSGDFEAILKAAQA